MWLQQYILTAKNKPFIIIKVDIEMKVVIIFPILWNSWNSETATKTRNNVGWDLILSIRI